MVEKTLIIKFNKFLFSNLSEKFVEQQKLQSIFLWEMIILERQYLHSK